MNLTKQFFKYVSQNIFGLIGTSCYILADTYFIAQAAGTDGVTLLNLCLPMYNLIFAFGSMIGLGAATRYAILQAQGEARAQRYFSNAILCACLIAIPFMLAGAFCPGTLLQLMGGDADIVALGLNYTRIFLLFTPFFMCNYIFSAFVRNDGDPSLAMVATLSGSLFNVVFDYIFIFPMGWACPARRWQRPSRRCSASPSAAATSFKRAARSPLSGRLPRPGCWCRAASWASPVLSGSFPLP